MLHQASCLHTATDRRPETGARIDVLTEPAAIARLGADWNGLFRRVGKGTHVFQSHQWASHFIRHFCASGEHQPCVVTARCNGELVLIWPMMLTTNLGVKRLEWLSEPFGQYGDVLIAGPSEFNQDDILTAAWHAAIRKLRPDVSILRRVRRDAAVRPFLQRQHALQINEQQAPCIDIKAAGTFDGLSATRLSARESRNRRRLLRRLGELGEVSFRCLAGGSEAAAIVSKAVEMKRTWARSRGLVASPMNHRNAVGFFSDLTAQRDGPVEFHVHALYCAQNLVSAQLHLDYAGHRSWYLSVYDLEFEKNRCGILHFDNAVATAFADKVDTFDMLPPASDYKSAWSTASVPVWDYAVALTWRGRAFTKAYLCQFKPQLKASLEAMPVSVRRYVASLTG